MTFFEVLEQVVALLRRHARVSYRALKRQFELDDAFLDDLKAELLDSQHPVRDENGRFLVWTGDPIDGGATETNRPADALASARGDLRAPEAERRQLTVMFCDLEGRRRTKLSR